LTPRPAVSRNCVAQGKKAGNMTQAPHVYVLSKQLVDIYFRCMESETEMKGMDALSLAHEISKIPDGTFTIAFFSCSRSKNKASSQLTIKKGCKTRAQLPNEAFDIDSDNFFLFTDSEGNPKMCYRILIRFMGFPQDNFKLRKIRFV
jgi:hypothetical protein